VHTFLSAPPNTRACARCDSRSPPDPSVGHRLTGTPETPYANTTASNGSTCDGATPVVSETIGNGAVVTTSASLAVILGTVEVTLYGGVRATKASPKADVA
jgi:hypothetical protein